MSTYASSSPALLATVLRRSATVAVAVVVGSAMSSIVGCSPSTEDEAPSSDLESASSAAAPTMAASLSNSTGAADGLACVPYAAGVALVGWGALDLATATTASVAIVATAPATGGTSLMATPLPGAATFSGLAKVTAGTGIIWIADATRMADACARALDGLASGLATATITARATPLEKVKEAVNSLRLRFRSCTYQDTYTANAQADCNYVYGSGPASLFKRFPLTVSSVATKTQNCILPSPCNTLELRMAAEAEWWGTCSAECTAIIAGPACTGAVARSYRDATVVSAATSCGLNACRTRWAGSHVCTQIQ